MCKPAHANDTKRFSLEHMPVSYWIMQVWQSDNSQLIHPFVPACRGRRQKSFNFNIFPGWRNCTYVLHIWYCFFMQLLYLHHMCIFTDCWYSAILWQIVYMSMSGGVHPILVQYTNASRENIIFHCWISWKWLTEKLTFF